MKKPLPNDGAYHQTCLFAGVVRECGPDYIIVEQRNRFVIGDTLEVLSPHSLRESFCVAYMEDQWGNRVETAPHPQQLLKIPCSLHLEPGDILRLRIKGEKEYD